MGGAALGNGVAGPHRGQEMSPRGEGATGRRRVGTAARRLGASSKNSRLGSPSSDSRQTPSSPPLSIARIVASTRDRFSAGPASVSGDRGPCSPSAPAGRRDRGRTIGGRPSRLEALLVGIGPTKV